MANNFGTVNTIIMGVGTLIIVTIVMFLLVSTLSDSQLFDSTATSETNVNDTSAFINSTGYTLAVVTDFKGRGFALNNVTNATGESISAGNFTFNSATGLITNATHYVWPSVNISFNYSKPSEYEMTTTILGGNFTDGTDNIAEKVPTVLLISAVIILLAVLVLLWSVARSSGVVSSTNSL